MVILFVLLALSTVEVVKTSEVAAESSVIVISNFVVDVVLSDINVDILEVRAANESAPEGVDLIYRIVHALLS